MKFPIIPILPFLNNPKDLDPSYKTDLDLRDCFGRKKLCLIIEEYGNPQFILYRIIAQTDQLVSQKYSFKNLYHRCQKSQPSAQNISC